MATRFTLPSQHRHPVNRRLYDEATFGERAADRVAAFLGSWRFIIIQTAIIVSWIGWNAGVAIRYFHTGVFDPFPFILLNLVFSTQAAYSAPILQLASNRSSARDRMRDESDYRHNVISLTVLHILHEEIHGEGCTCWVSRIEREEGEAP